MRMDRERRSHVLPPSRKARRQSLAAVLKNEPPPRDGDDLDLFSVLPVQGRRAILDTLKNRSAS